MKITKSQLKEIIKEEAVKLQKANLLRERRDQIVKEINQLNEGKDTGNPYDLNNPSNLEEFYNKIIDVWTKYCGQSPNDWGVSNDNRVILYNLLESGDLARKINNVWSPATLNVAQSGSDYYTNNPEDMKAHLNKMGETDYTLSPGHSIQKDEERLKSFESINESSVSAEDLKKKRIQSNVEWKNKRDLESRTLDDINEILIDNPVKLYDGPYEGRVNVYHRPIMNSATRVTMPHQGEYWGGGGVASVEFGRDDFMSISPNEVKAIGYSIPNQTYRNTDKDGVETILKIVKKIIDKSGYWNDSEISQIMRNVINYFSQFVIDVDNLEVISEK